ncbi:hypothetical protein M422DRAFT_47430 [Sphaerobolus stellatus SS14]|uniref:Uncharacterized protein n=1 Tax=Sphaerobolus stellatus (strain SS14) TaxID=990650 RepID=A0A0C9VBL0_SPHS4|nr:hypothetical protein M422DRAFT_47430 [Sphaerobolus stellatus SS14]
MDSSSTPSPAGVTVSFAPDEPATLLRLEQVVHASVYLGAMAYGLHLTTFFNAMKAILSDAEKRHWKWIPFVGSTFLLGTINIAALIRFNQLAWIDDRNFPGGPVGFLLGQQNTPANIISIATAIIMIALGDSFLIVRCHALWRNIYISAGLFALLIAAIVISVLHFIQVVGVKTLSEDVLNLKFSIPFATLVTALNVLICLLLLWRIFDLRRRLPSDLNDIAKRQFKSLESVIIETAMPIGVLSFAFLMLYIANSPGSILVFPLLVQALGIMPSLIILRMMGGYAWSTRVLRTIGSSIVLRGQLGRTPGTNELSAISFNNAQFAHSLDLKNQTHP